VRYRLHANAAGALVPGVRYRVHAPGTDEVAVDVALDDDDAGKRRGAYR